MAAQLEKEKATGAGVVPGGPSEMQRAEESIDEGVPVMLPRQGVGYQPRHGRV